MIFLRVKIDSNGNTFNFRHEMPDNFNFSKENQELISIVDNDCKELHLKNIEDVTLFIKCDW
jgi:hypothetical protein